MAGVNQVSEGQAAVPAVRGLARGRTLILIDGARVSSERRVGPSATFLDPDVIEGVEVARGPGSVAYGSDAFGGVISVRTRSRRPASSFRRARHRPPAASGFLTTASAGSYRRASSQGGALFAAHTRKADDYDGPGRRGFQFRIRRSRLSRTRDLPLGQGLSRRAGRAILAVISNGHATTRAWCASITPPKIRIA